MNGKYRNWFFTFSCDFHDDDCKEWKNIRDKIETEQIRAVIVSDVEIGDEENNYEHRHGIIQFENVMRFNTMKKMFPHAHIEVCKDVPAAIDYCTKNCTVENCLFYVNKFKTHGQRGDLQKIVEECKDIKEVMDEHPEEYCRYRKGLIDLMTRKNEDQEVLDWLEVKEIEVDYYTGESGSGKTYAAKQIGRDYMKKGKKVAIINFDVNGFVKITGPEEAELLIINEFRDSCLRFHEFLGILTGEDGVNPKGKEKVFFRNCNRIIITSIIEPWELYKKVNESKEQIKRRIKRIWRCRKEKGEYYVDPESWQEEQDLTQDDY